MDSDIFHLILDALSTENGALKLSSLIVHYLSKRFAIEYDCTEIEDLMKMFVAFCESVSASGDKFVQLSEDDQFVLENSFKIIYNEQLNSGDFEIIVKNIVLKSSNCIKSAIILDNLISYINKYLNYNIHLDAFSHRMDHVSANREKMYAVIERIFALPCSDIENSIETIIKKVGFEILGHLFCETSSSIYFAQCCIVADVICNKMENSHESVTNSFMPSISLALKSKSGKSLLQKCLSNNTFCCSLNLFLKTYLKTLADNPNSTRDINIYQSHCHMSYIIYINFNEINNRYLDIFTELNENNFLQNYLTNINMIYS